jgi:hypothetical protein
MPFDGDWQPDEQGWTIKVEPSPSILKHWRHWPSARREAYHEIAAGMAFHVVTAIQENDLATRRAGLRLPQGIVRYFLRRLRDERNCICVTIFEIDFYDPDTDPDNDPDGGAKAPAPLEPLVLDITGRGRRYAVIYVEGVFRVPPRSNTIAPPLPISWPRPDFICANAPELFRDRVIAPLVSQPNDFPGPFIQPKSVTTHTMPQPHMQAILAHALLLLVRGARDRDVIEISAIESAHMARNSNTFSARTVFCENQEFTTNATGSRSPYPIFAQYGLPSGSSHPIRPPGLS